ncbi:MAG: hypothetical protein EGS41_10485 [Prevotella sp.]|uniref:AAA family ATPase n=1 Tax=Prevotella sp. TaxID=59823 RepID=UPI0025EE3B38|nr:hypothetical protein [Prevotella sp.]
MNKITRRRLPVGIQSFKKIREERYLYVDKSDIVWDLANDSVASINHESRRRYTVHTSTTLSSSRYLPVA